MRIPCIPCDVSQVFQLSWVATPTHQSMFQHITNPDDGERSNFTTSTHGFPATGYLVRHCQCGHQGRISLVDFWGRTGTSGAASHYRPQATLRLVIATGVVDPKIALLITASTDRPTFSWFSPCVSAQIRLKLLIMGWSYNVRLISTGHQLQVSHSLGILVALADLWAHPRCEAFSCKSGAEATSMSSQPSPELAPLRGCPVMVATRLLNSPTRRTEIANTWPVLPWSCANHPKPSSIFQLAKEIGTVLKQ